MMMLKKSAILGAAGLALTVISPTAFAAPAEDEVTALPGFNGSLPFKFYSGFIDASSTKHLHYILVESQNDPSTDPVAIWFNGGPGCSSLDGFLYEHGPFRFAPYDGSSPPQLELFEYAWNKLATMIYIEQPVGVGFSYSSADDPTPDYQCTDDTAAADNLAAVQMLFDTKFPEYKSHDLYITGESYAGIYVPTLAEAIIQAGDNYTGAPLKGIAVGNGCSGDEIGICAFGSSQSKYYTTAFLMNSGFAPETLKSKIADECDLDAWKQGAETTAACDDAVDELDLLTERLDTYCVYCDCGQQFPADGASYSVASSKPSRAQMRPDRITNRKGNNNNDFLTKHPPVKPHAETTACIDSDAASAYLNQPEVQQALHVDAANNDDWAVCNDAPGWSYTSTRPNLPRDTYPLLVSNIAVTIYNGDWDNCVPYTDNEAWTLSMGFNITQAWHPWTSQVNGYTSVGGYATQFTVDGPLFQFTTVRGGRHEVPETAPERAFEMIQHVFTSTPL